jgi:hypothetical protein
MSDHIEQFFRHDHLPIALRDISAPFCELAEWIVQTIPRNPERTVALRKLLEAKDAAVRAYIAGELPHLVAGTGERIEGPYSAR